MLQALIGEESTTSGAAHSIEVRQDVQQNHSFGISDGANVLRLDDDRTELGAGPLSWQNGASDDSFASQVSKLAVNACSAHGSC